MQLEALWLQVAPVPTAVPELRCYAWIFMKYVLMLSLAVLFCGCVPFVEQVTYSDYSNRYHNNLWVRVNTQEGFFRPGPCRLFGFDHINYSFDMTTKSNEYTQDQMQVSILSGDPTESFKLKSALVTITNQKPNRITVHLRVDDDRVPKFINGTYKLRVAEQTSTGVHYESR